VVVLAGIDVSVAVGKLVGVSVGAVVLVTLRFSVGVGTTDATLLGMFVGVLPVGTAGCGVGLAIGSTRLGTGAAVAGAVLSFAMVDVAVMSTRSGVAGGSPAAGVRSAVGTAGLGDDVGDTVGVGELLAGTIGAKMATGTTPGSIGGKLLSRSAASAAWGLGGGRSGIAPISHAR
jgi:hypothetical protein